MNRYPAWLNILVLTLLLAGILLALPNIYGSAPAVQLAGKDGADISETRLEEFVRVIDNAGVTPEAAYTKDGRAVIRFSSNNDQVEASKRLRDNYDREFGVATTLAPRLPDWVRGLGLNPMSLGLDLRGGVYVLLEVDMDTAVNKRLELYQEDFDDRLREARIRHRVDLVDGVVTIRLTSVEDLETVRTIVRNADSDIIITDGADGRSLRIRMTETQVQARQDLAIEQNITTLRNRVNELGVAEPIVQRQGVDRIVVQLPGVQ
ncbi:MAG: protein translocase subunit SecD, partial [Gammaproteobacteria bacterium]|nr:protein translocase subunit SecD [Gammaproteobacteria bacterium]